jgi:hypothetical protein
MMNQIFFCYSFHWKRQRLFSTAMVFGFAGYLIFPPEYINGMPKYQQGMLYFSEIGGAIAILG